MSGTVAGRSSPFSISFETSVSGEHITSYLLLINTGSKSGTTLTTPFQSPSSIHLLTLNDASADKARSLIDQELLKLEDSIRVLRSRRNVLVPISQLPPEILSKIFADCVAECRESTNSLEWIRVTHVSHHWRTVAFDCPSLWGNPVFTRPKWTEEMLRHSNMTSLVVKADLSCFTPRIFEAV